MNLLDRLAELSAAASADEPAQAVERAREIVRAGLDAHEVIVIWGGVDGGFQRLGERACAFSDTALWVVHRELTHADASLGFEVDGKRVGGFRLPAPDAVLTQIAARLPVRRSAAEMVVVCGSWPEGPGEARLRFFEAAIAPLTLAVQRMLEDGHARMERGQATAVADIARLLSDSEDIEDTLPRLCNVIAAASQMDHVSLDVLDRGSGAMVRRALNDTRYGGGAMSERWRRAVRRPNPLQAEALRDGRPVLLPDVQNDPRVDEKSQAFFRTSLIVSAAIVPLLLRDGPIGVIGFASGKPQTFENLPYLEGLASQAAMTLKGMEMYRELAESREHLRDLNERLRESMRVEHHLARTDPLTGIPNRRYVNEVLEAECERARREASPLSVALADIDHFKQINDSMGHEAGDEVLKQLGAMARERSGAGYVAGRYGGDEFVFVMPGIHLPAASGLVGRFRRRVETRQFWIGGAGTALVTLSFGVAEALDEEATPERLIGYADEALYEAKHRGRNCVAAYEDGQASVRRVA